MRALVMALVLALGSAAARAELAEIRWDAQGQATQRFTVAPAQFAEYCGKLAKGQTVRWRFDGDGALNFNIHFHVGKAVEFPVKQDGVSQLAGELKVEQDQDYCWMWSNKAARPARLNVQLQR